MDTNTISTGKEFDHGLSATQPYLTIAALTFLALSPGPDEVTWQVAFFALVPLALGAMTQPVGRVMNSDPKLRFWLRSSPIFCIGDMLYFLLRVAIDHILEPTWSWRHFKAELYYRFRDEKWSERPNEVEKAALGRWILILLGAIPCQTIKLMAMQGIPRTQTLALLYFISLILGEILNIVAEASFRQVPTESVGRQPPLSESKPTWHEIFKKSCYIFQLEVTSVSVQSLVLLGVEALYVFNNYLAPYNDYNSPPLWQISAIIMNIAWLTLSGDLDLEERPSGYYFASIIILQYFSIYFIILGSLKIYLLKTLHNTVLLDVLFTAVSGATTFLVTGLLFIRFRNMSVFRMGWLRNTTVGQMIGIPASRIEANHLLVFLINTTVTLYCYAYLFSGTGTANPSWVGIFG